MVAPVECPVCKRPVMLTLTNKFRPHGPKDSPCEMSGETAPQTLAAPLPDEAPDIKARYGNELPASLPPDEQPIYTDATFEQLRDGTFRRIESNEVPVTIGGRVVGAAIVDDNGTMTAEISGSTVMAALSSVRSFDYEQPDHLPAAVTHPIEMNELELQIAAMVKEIFYQYTNRNGRSTQMTLGPSEIGTPCDRRLVMRLMGMPRVNPGGDNWASFRGTWVHAGLEKMFQWADAGRGRFATEVRVKLPSDTVPGGTADLLDRTLFMIDDHKVMGQWSLDKLRTKGITPVYRTQLHVYAYGARIRGERIEQVGLIGWPADKSDLNDLYVKTEPYDPEIARAALARPDALRAWIQKCEQDGMPRQQIAEVSTTADDCKFCPYHQPDAKDLTYGGCRGHRE